MTYSKRFKFKSSPDEVFEVVAAHWRPMATETWGDGITMLRGTGSSPILFLRRFKPDKDGVTCELDIPTADPPTWLDR